MTELHLDILQDPTFPIRIHAEGNRNSGPQGRQQEPVRTRTEVRATEG
jgi:hypothetical protein